jgi:hypothetical protein
VGEQVTAGTHLERELTQNLGQLPFWFLRLFLAVRGASAFHPVIGQTKPGPLLQAHESLTKWSGEFGSPCRLGLARG